MSMHRCLECEHNFDTDFALECPECGTPMDPDPDYEKNSFEINNELPSIGARNV